MKQVGIICGGYSSEFEISVKSAKTILNNFPEAYKPRLIYLRKSGWTIQLEEAEVPLHPTKFTFTENEEKQKIDLAIIYIHGDPGENGKVQAYLEMNDIPYVNSSPLASQLSFDKWYCNQFIKGFDVKVADSIFLTHPDHLPPTADVVAQLGLPIFVKPCDSGSSYGIARVEKEEDLKKAVAGAFAEGKTIVLEAFLDGTEVTCAVYRTPQGVKALPMTEIVSENAFFDYEAKYLGKSQEITPARIPDEQRDACQKISKQIYQLLSLRSIARVDFMLVQGVPYVIEVNTIPGFTAESLVPQMIAAEGLSIRDFWSEILEAELDASLI
ncbi:MAG: D-alanine--D-alanine ligase [bacterium]|nr:D-alanine--D-alanine ligase [bacterium]